MKEDKKDQRITVRLTPNEYFELETLSKELKTDKAKLIRSILDEFFHNYHK